MQCNVLENFQGEFIISHGYKNETHIVKTDDGYHLTLHRITGKQNDTQQNSTKPVVLMGHGLVSSSASFVLAGPKNGLGMKKKLNKNQIGFN